MSASERERLVGEVMGELSTLRHNMQDYTQNEEARERRAQDYERERLAAQAAAEKAPEPAQEINEKPAPTQVPPTSQRKASTFAVSQ